MESGGCAAGIVAGIHLVYGVICPSQLVHLADRKGNYILLSDLFLRVGNQYRPADATIQIGELHTVHILLGGIATIVLGIVGLIKFCKEP